MSDDNALLFIIKEARRRGKSFDEIERIHGIDASRAEAILSAHWQSKKIDPYEYRMLQLERLEGLIDVLTSMAELGNIKSAEVLLKNLEQINILLGLNLEQTKVEIKIVTEQQSEVVYKIVAGLTADLLSHIQRNVTNQRELAAVEEDWDELVATSYSGHVEEVLVAELVEAK